MTKLSIPQKSFALVYQAGIANVFEVDCLNTATFGREAKRLMQGDFKTCEAFAFGLAVAGHIVHTCACNMAGDITNQPWTFDLESAPFSDKFRPVFQRKMPGHTLALRHDD